MPNHIIDIRRTPTLEPPTKLGDLTAGLLLFFARPSPLQTWAELFGHEWRHVGITVRTPDGLMIASYGPRKCFRLDDPYEIMGAYNRVGVARVLSTYEEIESAEAYCRRFEHLERSDSPYTFSGIVLGPLHLAARRRDPGPLRSLLMFVVRLYCLFQKIRYRDRTAFGCSTFVWAVLDAVLERPLRMPLSAHPDDAAAYATPSNPLDELYARWLCGPTELWHAISPQCRSELDLSDIESTGPATASVNDAPITQLTPPQAPSAEWPVASQASA